VNSGRQGDSRVRGATTKMESPSSTTEVTPAKYHKLASEYAKVRSQVGVLRRAFLEEQAKNATLKDEIQERDQSQRKAEQEMDSLIFRNTQLEKRVGFLQTELDQAMMKGKPKKGQKSNAPLESQRSEEQQPIFDYELLTKIDEKIQLHRQVSEMEERLKRETNDLKNQLEEVKMDSVNRFDQESVDRVEAEKLSLTYSLQNALDEIEAYRDQVNQLQEKILVSAAAAQKRENDLVSELGSATATAAMTSPVQLLSSSTSLIDLDGVSDGVPMVDKLTRAEQQKEHWMLEYQLLKMKYSKIFMKWEEAKEILRDLGKDELISSEVTPSVETVQSFPTLIGKVEIISEDSEAWGRSYEKEVKDYLTSRINQLICLLQLTDSKAVTFHDECLSLEKHLLFSNQRKIDALNALEAIQAKYDEVKEELQLTKDNYETQLSSMTEHVAGLNDKLTGQEEKIEQLNYQLSSKGKSKK